METRLAKKTILIIKDRVNILNLKSHSLKNLTPKIPWDQKLVNCCLGSLCKEKYFWFNFFFWTSELHISQAFREYQVRQILTPYEPVANFCWKRVFSSFFQYFLRSSYMQLETAQGLKDRVLRKKFDLPIKSWFLNFFYFFFSAHGFAWCHLQCDCYDLNVKFLIFFKKFYKVHSVEVLSQDPRQEK
jgi:hypothetical protein